MKSFSLKFACLAASFFILMSCEPAKDSGEEPATTPMEESVSEVKNDLAEDKTQITLLLQNMYQWAQVNQEGEFPADENDTEAGFYMSTDSEKMETRIALFEKSGFFHPDFIENYKFIKSEIDLQLRDGTAKWSTDDRPPFEGYMTDPWCNCQDAPFEFWKKIEVRDLIVDGNSATANWTWGDGFMYKVSLKKEGQSWKVAGLQGFDVKNYTL